MIANCSNYLHFIFIKRNPQKMKDSEERILDKSIGAREQFLSIHNDNLRIWAMQVGRELKLDFAASRTWCTNFKNILSSKITKFVASADIKSYSEIKYSVNFISSGGGA